MTSHGKVMHTHIHTHIYHYIITIFLSVPFDTSCITAIMYSVGAVVVRAKTGSSNHGLSTH